MNDYAALEKSLTDALALALPPVAVCLVDSVPAGVPAYEGRVAAGCRFWQEATTRGFATSTPDHELCAIGVHTHNMGSRSPSFSNELGTALKVMNDLGYVREQDVAAIPVLDKETRHVVYAPLGQSPCPPDAVLLFTDSQQGLVVTEAVQQVDPDVPPALGRPACAIVPQVVNTGRAALSLGCCGARAYLDVMKDDVALWALPGARLSVYAERIVALAKANGVLAQFHQLRRKDVEAGGAPTVGESLARLQAG